jgi:ankyrin repeat protein
MVPSPSKTSICGETSLQEKICHSIAQLSPTCHIEDVCHVLDPLMRSWDDACLEQKDNRNNDNNISGTPVDVAADDYDVDDKQDLLGSDIDVRSVPDTNNNNYNINVGRITPLLVACDKGNVTCLEYLEEKFVTTTSTSLQEDERISTTYQLKRLQWFLGSPLDVSDVDDRNTPMHHAAMAGCCPAIAILHRIFMMCQQQLLLRDDRKSLHLSSVDVLLLLGTVRNSHNDTPLMMAVRSDNPVHFITTWVGLVNDAGEYRRCRHGRKCTPHEHSTDIANNNTYNKTIIQRALQSKNDSMDTCLTMGCSHGHVELVQFILQDSWDITVDIDDVDRCRTSFHRMEHVLNTNPELLTQYGRIRDRVILCLQLIDSNLGARADRAVQELLQTYDDNNNNDRNQNGVDVGKDKYSRKGCTGKKTLNFGAIQTGGSTRTKTDKKKKKKRNQDQKRDTDGTFDVLENKLSARSPIETDYKQQGTDNEETQSSGVVLTTHTNGKIAVHVNGRTILEEDDGDETLAVSLPETTTTTSTNQLLDSTDWLRDRFNDIFSESVAPPEDAVLSALCLDVRCLLYTEHGMALNLSSAQLDAVQKILRHQLSCVETARKIQQRMHSTN